MSVPSRSTTGKASTESEGKQFVALCTGATGISSVHLIRRLQQDSRFSKVYGVSRRELYDVDTAHVEHIKLDLLDSQKVKDELKAKGVSDGKCCRSRGAVLRESGVMCMQHAYKPTVADVQ